MKNDASKLFKYHCLKKVKFFSYCFKYCFEYCLCIHNWFGELQFLHFETPSETLWHTGGSRQGHPRYTSASTEGGRVAHNKLHTQHRIDKTKVTARRLGYQQFEDCFDTVLKSSEIFSCVLIPVLLQHVNTCQILSALLFVRGAFFVVASDCLNDYMREFAKVPLCCINECVRTCQKLSSTGSGRSDFMAH